MNFLIKASIFSIVLSLCHAQDSSTVIAEQMNSTESIIMASESTVSMNMSQSENQMTATLMVSAAANTASMNNSVAASVSSSSQDMNSQTVNQQQTSVAGSASVSQSGGASSQSVAASQSVAESQSPAQSASPSVANSISPSPADSSASMQPASSYIPDTFTKWEKPCEKSCCHHFDDGAWKSTADTVKINMTRTCPSSECISDKYNLTTIVEVTCKEGCKDECSSAAFLKISSLTFVVLFISMFKNVL